MFDLPKSTYFGKIIAKEKIYQHGSTGKAIEELFVTQVEGIRWLNKISHETINISQGKQVDEIEVIEIILRVPAPDNRILSKIRKAIPHKILFTLVYCNETTYTVFYDSETSYSSCTLPKMIGSDTDSIWENLIIQIGNISITEGRTLDEQIVVNTEHEKLTRKIEKLEKQAMSEKQPRKRWELAEEARKLRNDSEDLI